MVKVAHGAFNCKIKKVCGEVNVETHNYKVIVEGEVLRMPTFNSYLVIVSLNNDLTTYFFKLEIERHKRNYNLISHLRKHSIKGKIYNQTTFSRSMSHFLIALITFTFTLSTNLAQRAMFSRLADNFGTLIRFSNIKKQK